jgi:iron(III) transport system substrate-binding protein
MANGTARASHETSKNRTAGVHMNKLAAGLAGAVAAAAVVAMIPGAIAKTQLTVYTALENEQLRPYKTAFEAANPDVEIVWVRDSTGVITARLLAEKANPKADVVMGVAVTSLILFENEGMIEPYAVKGVDAMPRTRRPGSAWTPTCRPSATTRSRARSAAFPSPRAGPTC